MKLLPVFDALLAGWKSMGYELVPTRALFATLELRALPRHELIMGEIPGRSGTLALQGKEFLRVNALFPGFDRRQIALRGGRNQPKSSPV